MSFGVVDLHTEIPKKEHLSKDSFEKSIHEGTEDLEDVIDNAQSAIEWAKSISGNLSEGLKLKPLKQYGIGCDTDIIQRDLIIFLGNIHEDINKFQNTREILNECYIVLKRVVRLVNSSLNYLNGYVSKNKNDENISKLKEYQNTLALLKERVSDEQSFLNKYLENVVDKRMNQLYRIESSLRLLLGQE